MSTRAAPRERAPAMIWMECPYCRDGQLGGLDWPSPRRQPRWPRLLRQMRRLLAIVTALGILAGLMFAGLPS